MNDLVGLPPVLDACCGGRMFWWDKECPDALFMDNREVPRGAFANGWNPNWCVDPDVVADFRDMPFPDGAFRLVVYDPPHLTNGSMKSVINTKYGLLNKETWKQDLIDGFTECWRVLAPNGVLIFKWCEAGIKVKDLLRAFPATPLFGDFTGKTGKTIWVTYLKPNPQADGGRRPSQIQRPVGRTLSHGRRIMECKWTLFGLDGEPLMWRVECLGGGREFSPWGDLDAPRICPHCGGSPVVTNPERCRSLRDEIEAEAPNPEPTSGSNAPSGAAESLGRTKEGGR